MMMSSIPSPLTSPALDTARPLPVASINAIQTEAVAAIERRQVERRAEAIIWAAEAAEHHITLHQRWELRSGRRPYAPTIDVFEPVSH